MFWSLVIFVPEKAILRLACMWIVKKAKLHACSVIFTGCHCISCGYTVHDVHARAILDGA